MSRPLLLSAGSRGDFEPLFALASEFRANETTEKAVVFVQRDYLHVAPESNDRLKILSLNLTVADMMPSFDYAIEQAQPNTPASIIGWNGLGYAINKVVLPLLDEVLPAAADAKIDVVLTTHMTWSIAHIVAEKLGVPLIHLSLQPDAPSSFVPHPNVDPDGATDAFITLLDGRMPPASKANSDTYNILHDAGLPLYMERLNMLRKSVDLEALSYERARAILDCTAEVPTFIAVSPRLAPLPPDTPAKSVGAIAAAYIPQGYTPEKDHPELLEFLSNGPPPAIVSYGSLGCEDAVSLTQAVLSGLRAAGVRRIVMLPGGAGIGIDKIEDSELREWANGHTLTVQARVQYAWLLPRASLFLCHGGAGAVSAALRAGVPLVVTPIMFDQPFFGLIVSKLKLGSCTVRGLSAISADEIEKRAREALTSTVLQNVQQFSTREKKAKSATRMIVEMTRDLVLGE